MEPKIFHSKIRVAVFRGRDVCFCGQHRDSKNCTG